MNWNWLPGKSATVDVAPSRLDSKKLRALIDQATSDSADESDEHAGLLSVIREEVVCPFVARVGGETVECVRFEWPKNGYGLNAVCRSKNKTHRCRHQHARMDGATAQGPRMDRGLFCLARSVRLTDPFTSADQGRQTARDRGGSIAGLPRNRRRTTRLWRQK